MDHQLMRHNRIGIKRQERKALYTYILASITIRGTRVFNICDQGLKKRPGEVPHDWIGVDKQVTISRFVCLIT
jgi:hypothetical protein